MEEPTKVVAVTLKLCTACLVTFHQHNYHGNLASQCFSNVNRALDGPSRGYDVIHNCDPTAWAEERLAVVREAG